MIDAQPTAHPHLPAAAARARLSDGGLWVFGYGSLMWDPGVAHEALSPCRLHGYHRRFLLRSHDGAVHPFGRVKRSA